ncbi:MAG: hypothetical protein QM758_18550 [Armatimonas sp.]
MTYSINEFNIKADLDICCDKSINPNHFGFDISLDRGSLKEVPSLLRKVRRQLLYDVGTGFLLEPHVGEEEGVALFIDYKGKKLILDCKDQRIPVGAAWAIHAGLGAATLTNGGIPLHGAGIVINRRFTVIMASSTAGKSTLSWFLIQAGDLFANDDLVPAYVQEDHIQVFPARSLYPKLSRQVIDRNNLSLQDLYVADYGTNEEEYYAPLSLAQRIVDPMPLSQIIVLKPITASCGCGSGCDSCTCQDAGNDLEELEIVPRRLKTDEATTTLLSNLHASWLIPKMNAKVIFDLCHRIATTVPVIELRYKRSYAILPRIRQTIFDFSAL